MTDTKDAGGESPGGDIFQLIMKAVNDNGMHPLVKAAKVRALAAQANANVAAAAANEAADKEKTTSFCDCICCPFKVFWKWLDIKFSMEVDFPDRHRVTLLSCLGWWIILLGTTFCVAYAHEIANSSSDPIFWILTTTFGFVLFFLCCCCFGGKCCWTIGPGKVAFSAAVFKQIGYTVYSYVGNYLCSCFARCCSGKMKSFLDENPHHHSTGLKRHVCCGGAFEVLPVPLSTMMAMYNYSYIIADRASGEVAVIDPAVPSEIFAKLAELKTQWTLEGLPELKWTTVLVTHRHHDHAGGNREIVAKFGDKIRIVGGVRERVPCVTQKVRHGDEIYLGKHTRIRALATYAHTIGHISYFIDGRKKEAGGKASSGDDDDHPLLRRTDPPKNSSGRQSDEGSAGAVFTGDALFISGIGALFEGDEETWLRGMVSVATLPQETLLFPGHEYTEFFVPFAAYLEPTNMRVLQKLDYILRQRYGFHYPLTTVPSTVGEELACNPFLRCLTDTKAMARALGKNVKSSPAFMLRAMTKMQNRTCAIWDLPLAACNCKSSEPDSRRAGLRVTDVKVCIDLGGMKSSPDVCIKIKPLFEDKKRPTTTAAATSGGASSKADGASIGGGIELRAPSKT